MAKNKLEGIVTKGHGERFVVYAEDDRNYSCQLRGKVKFKTNMTTPVAVGDDVIIEKINDNTGVIEEVKKRRSVLSRPSVRRETVEHVIAANIDSLVVVTSIAEPSLKPGLIDRFLIAAQIGNLSPAIVINKIDLESETKPDEIARVYRALDFEIFLTSATSEITNPANEIDKLRKHLNNHRSILAGHSGVGKSTLLNHIFPGFDLPTSEVSRSSGRGKHTTSHVELFHLPGGGYVIDSPGIKVLGLWQLQKEGLDWYFPEMRQYRQGCRFTGCSHIPEPDCAVKQAVTDGKISKMRYDSYIQIYNSFEESF